MTRWPSDFDISSPRMRAIRSVDPPAGKPTTMVMSRVGNSWATAGAANNPAIDAADIRASANLAFIDFPRLIVVDLLAWNGFKPPLPIYRVVFEFDEGPTKDKRKMRE